MSNAVRETPAGNWAPLTINVAAGAAPSAVVAADRNRRSVTVINTGTVPVFLSAIEAAGRTNSLQLVAGAGYEFSHAQPVFAFLAAGEVTDGQLSIVTETGEG